jgi:hypothetical protein
MHLHETMASVPKTLFYVTRLCKIINNQSKNYKKKDKKTCIVCPQGDKVQSSLGAEYTVLVFGVFF